MSDTKEKYIFYHYSPSFAAAVAFIILFGLSTGFHTFQLLRKRTWYFIPFVIGGLFETIGYIGRALNSKETPDWTLPPYIMQSLLILLAPALFAASIYMILARIITLIDGESHSVIKVRWLTKTFVLGDVISFLAQSTGGGLMAKSKNPNDVKLAENIITAGLGIQVAFFGFFIVVAAIFHFRIRAVPTHVSQTIDVPWQQYLFILYAASFLIMVRSVFRIAEYVMGSDGALLTKEVYLYVFDAGLMLLAMLLFNVRHPSNIISKVYRGHARDHESQDSSYGMMERNVQAEFKR